MICPDLRCLVRRGEAASCQEPFESLRSLYLLICFSLHLTTFLPFLLLLLPLTSPSIFFLSPYLLLSTRDPLSIHYFLLPPPFVSPPFLPPLPLFCRFINVLPTGVPWRQAAKGVATATHRGLWSPRRVVGGGWGGGRDVNGCCILCVLEASPRSGGGRTIKY